MKQNIPTVYVVDDNAALRDSLSQLLHAADLTAECYADGPGFLAAYTEDRAGCLLLDMSMPGMTGLEVQQELKTRGLDIPIIFLTGHGDIPMAVKATRAGAIDFLEKPFQPDRLLERVEYCLGLDRTRRQGREQAESIRERHALLSPREREIIALIAKGLTNKLIARELDISPRTIEVHRTHIMHKMGANNLAELVRLYAHCDLSDAARDGQRIFPDQGPT
jgi:FixJ family two-component response regulator